MSSFWRYRIRFSKRGAIRFISHRDLMGVFARAFRRAGLPVRMSQGFNPRPRFSLPAPLPVGIEGLDEVLELDLTEEMPADEVGRRLSAEVPEGVEIIRAESLEPPAKARVASLTYRVTGRLPAGGVERCASAAELRVTRSDGREIDIKPYLKSIDRRDGGCEFEILVTRAGSARPAEIVSAICGEDGDLARHLSLARTAVNLLAP
ncbi:MAG: TIGR03936 family radical SAM-associated protein [Planctomycetota bacterium]